MWTVDVDDKDLVTYEVGEMDEIKEPGNDWVFAAKKRIAQLEAELAHMKQVAGDAAISYQHEKAIRERLETELAELRQIAEAAVGMVQVAREELAECRAKLAELSKHAPE